MPYIRSRLATAAVAAAALALLGTAVASAHEHREVGEYELVVGFLTEPAIVEEPNGLDLRVQEGHGDETAPVEGLANTLQAEVSFGGSTMRIAVEPRFGQPGAYRGMFIPTATGDYTFRIFGSINGMEVDERFTSGPDTFSSVGSRTAMTFPMQVDTVGEIAGQASAARDRADSARLFGIAGLVIGILGAAVGGAALWTARRTESRLGAAG